ncbi:hypothetical protein AJ79_08201 [Helicocarpus griseus UAMH5409]|uniref:Zn(2)-C6 fungal-type domain-containing protein n=1 Tax=Helicocarpus griseus UAMH5409 TaxID=1447875 RepID=A0A2B7WVF3_9EURO|nr:hypothetical protein AJ79_08201 [Helicocarpus griseus UAMH5409]
MAASTAQTAPRTCSRCKASKKKCDKTLPICGRCSGLSLPCAYTETVAQIAPEEIAANFSAIFGRLDRLEDQINVHGDQENAAAAVSSPVPERPQAGSGSGANANKWHMSPGLLHPAYLDIIAGSNTCKILEEKAMTVRDVGRKYSNTVGNSLPVISAHHFNIGADEVEGLRSRSRGGEFYLVVLSMVLILENPVDDPSSANSSQPEIYRISKYLFSMFVSLKDPSMRLVQAGILIALYEHAHCIDNRAYVAIGTCARLASLLRLIGCPGIDSNEETQVHITLRVLNDPLNFENPLGISSSSPTDAFSSHVKACHILDRVQHTLSQTSEDSAPNDTQSSQLSALQNETKHLIMGLEHSPPWHDALVTARG